MLPSRTSSPSSLATDTPIDGTSVSEVDLPATGTHDDSPADAQSHSSRRGRAFVLIVLAVVLGGVIAIGVLLSSRESTPPPKPDIPLDGWAPYWALDTSLPEVARLGSMREISPFWFNATGVDQIVVDPNAGVELTDRFMDEARGSTALVVPSIVDAMPPGGMAAVLADPVTRAQHVDAIAAFADEGDFDGIDIDYESFAFLDGRETWATTRPNWVAFITELGARLHADDRTLSVSIPPIYDAQQTADSGYWVYDYGAIAPHVDRIRIMAYDFSVDEAGPIAPLAWV